MAVLPPGAKIVTLPMKVVSGPHNGTPEYRSPDPVTGFMVGGQIAAIRACLRYKRVVMPWGRRAGKTTMRPFLWTEEAAMTAGRYTAGFITANHVKAWEMYQHCLAQFGDLVASSVGEPESQNRYIDLKALVKAEGAPIRRAYRDCPVIGPRIEAGYGKNSGARIYFWSGQHPHYRAIQGFPFKFHRIDVDEAQQIHPGITKIVNPMLLDSGGSLSVSGIADIDDIGNDWFLAYYEKASDPKKAARWKSLSFPTYSNPNLNAEAMREIEEDLLTIDDYEQYVWARFISGSGAVFRDLDSVFVVKPRWIREAPAHLDLPAWTSALLTRDRSDSLHAWIVSDRPTDGHGYAMTIDFAGRTKTRDATVIAVFDMTTNEQVALFQIRDMQSPGQLRWIEGIKAAYGVQEVHGDNTPEGAALMAYLRERHGVGIRGHNFSESNKAEYVKRAQFLFEMSEIRLIDCPAQREEFRIYRRITGESKFGKDTAVSYSHPPGKHDDFVSAFLQIAPSMAHGKRSIAQPEPKAVPIIDEKGTTTLALWGDGRAPWTKDDATSDLSLTEVVLPTPR